MHVLGDFNINFFDPAYKTHRLAKAFRNLNLQDTGKLEVKTEKASIAQVPNHKRLGMILDEDLTYEVHIDEQGFQ